MDELTISVTIADRPYRLTIRREEEEMIRKAAIEINKKLKQYSDNYAFNDKQDLLAMVALEKTTNALQSEIELEKNERELLLELSDIENEFKKLREADY
ncbi:MAG: cell division protein ZapA [Bacteroidales bacterium]|nr:cell division protein ZapA [Bacteroidales bacterium]